jgi:hypothetical protein
MRYKLHGTAFLFKLQFLSLSRNSLVSWNMKAHYHVHKGPQFEPILSYVNPVHTLAPRFSKIQFKYYPPIYT